MLKILKFLAMVAAGLLVVTLLAEERAGRNVVQIDAMEGDGKRPATALKGEDEDDDVEVSFGETTVRVREAVPGPDGSFVQREVRRVSFVEGVPDEGNFAAKDPFVELLDTERDGPDGTPLVVGTIRSERATFLMGDAVGGNVEVDLTEVSPERYSLIGDVHGEFFHDDGTTSTFDTARVDVDGPVLTAPESFTLDHPRMTMRGLGLTWNQETGVIRVRADAQFSVPVGAATIGWDLFAPGGLEGVLPPVGDGDEQEGDARSSAVLDMTGPVVGVTSDGARFVGDLLQFDGPSDTLTFHGNASFEHRLDGRDMRLDADRIVAELPPPQSDEGDDRPDRALDRVDASGDVTVVSAGDTTTPSWLWAPTLTIEDGVVRSPDIVRWEVDGIMTVGKDLTHHLEDGDLRLSGPTTMTVESGELAGMEVFAPGGMAWSVPPPRHEDTERDIAGEMRGGVTGSMADGTRFAGQQLRVDGPARVVTLDEDVVVEKQRRRIDADRLVASGSADEDGPTTFIASGNVVAVGTPTGESGAPTTRVVTDELSMTGDVGTARGIVTILRGGLTISGNGLTWDETTGRVRIPRDAHLVDVTPRIDADGEPVTAHTDLLARGGLDWTIPPDAVSTFDEGRGVMFGPVTGTTSDGVTLDAGLVEHDGPARTLELRDGARIETRGSNGEPVVVTGDHILATRIDDGAPGSLPLHRIESERPITIERPDLTIRGDTVLYDELQRLLTISRDPRLESRTPDGGVDFWLEGDGQLTWHLPADPDASIVDGRGRIDGPQVRGGTDDGLRFGGTALEMGPGLRELDLIGPGWIAQRRGARDDRIDATARIDLVRNTVGDIETVDATGGVVGELVDAVARTDVTARSLHVDRTRRRTVLSGDAKIVRTTPQDVHTVTAERQIVAETDFADELQRIEADGAVTMTTGDVQVWCDELSWDVPGDLAILRGSCRAVMPGGFEYQAEEIRVRPESGDVESR